MFNQTTGIDPDIDRFIQKDKTTGAIIGIRVSWPRDDGEAILGNSPYWYYKMVSPDTPPSEGPQYSVQQDGEAPWIFTDYAEPGINLPKGDVKENFVLVLRSQPEQKLQVDAVYSHVVQIVHPSALEPARSVRVSAALARLAAGASISAEEQALLDENAAQANDFAACDARRTALYAAIDASQPYDMLAGWPLAPEQIDVFAPPIP